MTMSDGEPDLVVPVEEAPDLQTIYKVLVDGKRARRNGNLQCSGSDDAFCYLCQFQDAPGSDGKLLKDHINEMVTHGKEAVQIARVIKRIYDTEIREYCTHTITRADGSEHSVAKPEWTLDLIVRHLLLSPETERVFENYQNQIYKSMIIRQSERVVDPDTGEVDEEQSKRLVNIMNAFDNHKTRLSAIGLRQHKRPKLSS